MTKIRVEIEFDGPYGPDEEFEVENKSWLCPANIALVLRQVLSNTTNISVRELN